MKVSKVNNEELLRAVVADECKRSLFYFVKTFWSVIIKEKAVYNWHIPYLCEELETLAWYIVNRKEKPYDLLINIPPGTTKSTIVTIIFPAWLWTIDPTLRIISNSYSSDLSIEHSIKSRDIITSERYKKLFPEVVLRKDKFAKASYENTSTGARYTTSTGGTITGKHAHVIINDDPLNPKQAASEADRKSAIEHVKTLASRKVDKAITPTITIMQRLHESDVTGYILSKKSDKVRHICLPAEASKNVKPDELLDSYVDGLLDPIRLSRNVLEEQKTDLGSIAYSGQFQQNPVVAGGNIVKKEWFKHVSRKEFERIRDNEPIHFFADTAYTDSGDNDPTGIIATCYIENVVYVVKGKKVLMQFPDLIKFIKEFVQANGYDGRSTIRIEPKANGISVIQQLKRSTSLNITQTPTPRDGKGVRLNAASPIVECGRCVLVNDVWNEEFIDEVTGFPNKDHDEYVDVLCYAIDYYTSKGADMTDAEILKIFR